MKILARLLAKLFAPDPPIDAAEIERVEEMAKRERREEGAFPPDEIR